MSKYHVLHPIDNGRKFAGTGKKKVFIRGEVVELNDDDALELLRSGHVRPVQVNAAVVDDATDLSRSAVADTSIDLARMKNAELIEYGLATFQLQLAPTLTKAQLLEQIAIAQAAAKVTV